MNLEKDLIGVRFGRLMVKSYAGKKNRYHCWNCVCDCGNELVVRQSNLLSGHTKSCGCKNLPSENRHYVNGTCIETIASKKLFKNNSSGVRGVYWDKKNRKWVAQITFQGKTRRLGSFEKIDDAERARSDAEKEFFEPFLKEYHSGNENRGEN